METAKKTLSIKASALGLGGVFFSRSEIDVYHKLAKETS